MNIFGYIIAAALRDKIVAADRQTGWAVLTDGRRVKFPLDFDWPLAEFNERGWPMQMIN